MSDDEKTDSRTAACGSGTKLSTSPDTTTSAESSGSGSADASPATTCTRSPSLAPAAARNPLDGSTPITAAGSHSARIASESTPVPHPTSTQRACWGAAMRSRNRGAMRRLHRPMQRSYGSPCCQVTADVMALFYRGSPSRKARTTA